jgi:hypothetical protein
MSGYSGFSMSNNAVEAHRRGLVTAKDTGVPAHLVEEYCRYEEWHHTSSMYNSTPFYNREYVRATFGLEKSEDYDPDPEAIEALQSYKRNLKNSKTYDNCHVEWIEWSGTRKHPRATKMEANGCRVTVKGNTATIELPPDSCWHKKSFKKRLTANGFSFSTSVSQKGETNES